MAGPKTGYLTIQNFRYGLDARRSELTSQPGTLLRAIDCHINQGAEIEKRKAFVKTALPANVFLGLAALNTQYAFGSIAPPSMPNGFTYQQLTSPLGSAMTALVDATLYNDEAFVVATFGTDGTFCFFNGILVPDFTSGVVLAGQTPTATQAANLVSLINATTNYTASRTGSSVTISGTVQATYTISNTITSAAGVLTTTQDNLPTPAYPATAPIGSFLIVAGSLGTGATLASVYSVIVTNTSLGTLPVYSQTITSAAIQWQGDATSTAAAVATNINQNVVNNGGYTAIANGSNVSVYAPIGGTYDGYDISVLGESSSNNDGAIVFQDCVFTWTIPLGGNATITGIQDTVNSVTLTTTSRALSSYPSVNAWLSQVAADIIAYGPVHGVSPYDAAAVGNNLYIGVNGDTTEAPIAGSITVTYTETGGSTVTGTPALQAIISPQNVSATGQSVTVTAKNGVPPYNYVWSSNGSVVFSGQGTATIVVQSIPTTTFKGVFVGSPASIITCRITDASGATVNLSITITQYGNNN